MFYKFIELSRSFLRCNVKSQIFTERSNLLKDMIANALARNKSKPDLNVFFVTFTKGKVLTTVPLTRKRALLILITNELKHIQGILKENTIKVAESCVSQLEYVLALRVRRAQQVFSLYTKLWDDTALRLVINKLRKQFLQRGHAFMLGLTAATVVNWNEEMIKDEDLLRHSNELEMCHRLKSRKNGPTNKSNESPGPCVACDSNTEDDCWEPFITTGDLTCWKRESPSKKKGSGLYCYKMYGSYNDVTANDFLEAFLDIKERKTWDTHVVDLHIITSDAQSNSDLIYWETKWPTLFNNRDYVFKRRYKILNKEKIIVVANRNSSHPNYPVYSSKTRVTEYWSYMVIKPFTHFCKPGIEFSLTYFDDPGAALPSTLSLWASTTGMPEFMKKLRLAATRVGYLRTTQGTPPLIPDDDCATASADEKEVVDESVDDICDTTFFHKFPFFYPPRDEEILILQMLVT